jgi:hypothetical protein
MSEAESLQQSKIAVAMVWQHLPFGVGRSAMATAILVVQGLALPSRCSIQRASRTNGSPRSKYINATNRPAPK